MTSYFDRTFRLDTADDNNRKFKLYTESQKKRYIVDI